MKFVNSTKYEEYLQSKHLEKLINKPTIEDQIFPLNRIQVKTFNLQGNALFLPSYLYLREKLEININDEQVNLLDCMYVYDKANDEEVILQIINFKDNKIKAIKKLSFPDIISYLEEETRQISLKMIRERKLSCDSAALSLESYEDLFYDGYVRQSTKQQQGMQNFNLQADIVGGKYLFLCIKSKFQIELSVLNLDLSLIMQHNIEMVNHAYPNQDYEDQHIDYIEPGLIYFLYKQYIIKIDLNKKEVLLNMLEYKFPKTQLLRLLPVTLCEFKYYFSKNKDRNLLGYNNDNNDKIVLYVIAENVVYQLNMHNLDILRQTNIFNFYFSQQPLNQQESKDFGIQKVLVVPIRLKDRQRKTFSNWTFLIQAKQYGYILQDWKEQNLFNIQKLKLPEELVLKQKCDYEFFLNDQNIVSSQDKVYFASESFYNHYYEFRVFKKKGCRNYTYTCQLKETNFKLYQNHRILSNLPPIIYNNQLTYPTYTNINDQSLAFYQFKEENVNQAQYILQEIDQSDYKQIFYYGDQLDFQNGSTAFVYKLENNKLTHKIFCYDGEIDITQQRQLNVNNLEQVYFIKEDNIFSLNSLKLQDQPQEPKIQRLFSEIVSFSQFHSDHKNNVFLPMIYKSNQTQFFAIYDVDKKMIINQTIHKSQYTIHLLSYFDQQKNEKGIQQKYISILDSDYNQLKFIDFNYIIEKNTEIKNQNTNLPIVKILSSGKILISFGTNKLYQIIQQF
ncbi:hypothetical protein ABPG74_009826 [Tetrahymena malaccensis]